MDPYPPDNYLSAWHGSEQVNWVALSCYAVAMLHADIPCHNEDLHTLRSEVRTRYKLLFVILVRESVLAC